MKIQGFNWDNGNIEKIQERGLSIDEVEEFLNTNPFIRPDEAHSSKETRFIVFGRFRDRFLFVALTFRAIEGQLRIRVISVRYAHKREVEKFYDKIKD